MEGREFGVDGFPFSLVDRFSLPFYMSITAVMYM